MGNIIFLVLILVSYAGLYKLFEKAGLPAWKALIPVYNFCVTSKLIDKPWWWGLIMIVPGVNLIMYGVYGFNLARAFGKRTTNDLLFASLLPYIFFVKIGFDKNAKFIGVKDIKTESALVKNWLDPIIFAVVAASIIRTFFFEAFTIPTSSLEKSLMVGDFLFVNKVCYGAKVPQTPISFPFAHHTLPFTQSTKSYLEWIKLPYFRLPGYSSPKNGEIVVFNYPDGDTVAVGCQDRSYYQLVRDYGYSNIHNPHFIVGNSEDSKPVGDIVARPVDKREHYVKRCVAIAGDKFEIKDGEIYINDQKQAMPEKAQHFYIVKTQGMVFGTVDFDQNGQAYNPKMNFELLDKFDINVPEAGIYNVRRDTMFYMLNMPADVANEVKAYPGVLSVTKMISPKGEFNKDIFPHSTRYPWNNDNYGPLVIPKAGATVQIDTGNICIYEKILSTYDDGIHQITRNGAQVLYDGKPLTSYTFKQDYYWMMGDNRHNSADSRFWGFVPFDHVVGRPVFVWFSMKDPKNNPVSGSNLLGSLFKNSKEGKFRWERFMCYVGEDGLVSWKIPVFALIALIWAYSYWSKKRKAPARQKK
ncbi:MAG: signal peptidase I [Bacteroidetes bacterium]|nr:signal peptidase I [Bacteroidota bacterium]